MMNYDSFEQASLDHPVLNISEKLTELNSGFKSRWTPEYEAFLKMPKNIDGNIYRWLGINTTDSAADLGAFKVPTIESIKQMWNGVDLTEGNHSLGLKEISKWEINPDFKYQNQKQHAGFAAEVIGTIKENMLAVKNETGIQTFRADDRPDLFQKNDQYVDKIRVHPDGIIEKIQVKFVGKDAGECLSKLASKRFDKYFQDGMVDKMEVPKNYYDGIKEMIPERTAKLEKQLQRVKETGKTEAVQNLEKRIERYQKIDQMLERSTLTSHEALEAVKHPRRYTAKLMAENTFGKSLESGMEGAKMAAMMTVAISTIDNVSKCLEGEMTPREAFVDVAKDAGLASGTAFGAAFISTEVAQLMSASSHQLIQSLGNAAIPAAVISLGVQTFDSVSDYADGTINGQQLAYDLGDSLSQVAGSAAAGALAGSIVPGAGTVTGFATGMVAGMVGCAVASEAYASVVKYGAEGADVLLDKAKDMASRTVEIAKDVSPDQIDSIVASINEYTSVNSIPFRVNTL